MINTKLFWKKGFLVSLFVLSFKFVFAQQAISDSIPTIINPFDETIDIGYGFQKKREITSSVASIKSEEFNKGNINNPWQLIQGKVSGLSISKPGGDPNGSY
jgi:iron complex outermembrane receptor protein